MAEDIEREKEEKSLKEFINKMDWAKFLHFGSISIQLRDGKPTLVRIEKTIKMD